MKHALLFLILLLTFFPFSGVYAQIVYDHIVSNVLRDNEINSSLPVIN